MYTSGTATLRSSAHRAVYSKSRKEAPPPAAPSGRLPDAVREVHFVDYDVSRHDLRPAIVSLLHRAGPCVGDWGESSSDRRLEDFVVAVEALKGNNGTCEEAQAHLADLVAADEGQGGSAEVGEGGNLGRDCVRLDQGGGGGGGGAGSAGLLPMFDRLVTGVILPHLKRRLAACGALDPKGGDKGDGAFRFWYQRPPTLRLQPGPSSRYVRPHCDAEYGHQDGELNFWMPLTDVGETQTTLWVESAPDEGDYAPLAVNFGQVALFHGSSRRHHVPANPTMATRMSLDFRIGVEGYFDPAWTMRGTKADHNRREVVL